MNSSIEIGYNHQATGDDFKLTIDMIHLGRCDTVTPAESKVSTELIRTLISVDKLFFKDQK